MYVSRPGIEPAKMRYTMTKLANVLPHTEPQTPLEAVYHHAVLNFVDTVRRCHPFQEPADIGRQIELLTAVLAVFVAKIQLLRSSGTAGDQLAADVLTAEVAWVETRITQHLKHLPS